MPLRLPPLLLLAALAGCTDLPGYPPLDAGPDLGPLCSEPCGPDASDGGTDAESALDAGLDAPPWMAEELGSVFSDAGCCADCLQSWRDCCSSCMRTCLEVSGDSGAATAACEQSCGSNDPASCSPSLNVCSVGACGADACAPAPAACP